MVVPGPLQYGAKTKSVEELQVLLRDAGLYDHDIDGFFGQYTAVAISLFQARFGVFDDGHWNELTVRVANDLLDQDGTVDSRVLCGEIPPPA
jgi:peptidoglycan hydrolase-like protein with peptidoglycan-binding domain